MLGGCGGSKEDADADATATVAPVEDLYNNGIDALNAGRYDSATDQFNLVEQNYPYSSWAVNAQLMQGYTQYLRNRYTEAIGTLDRFIQLHPAHRDVAYAYYLRALCYYEQIADIQRDQRGTELAMEALQQVVNRFPDSAYARDCTAEDRPLPRPSGRQGDGDRTLVRGPASLRGIDRTVSAGGG